MSDADRSAIDLAECARLLTFYRAACETRAPVLNGQLPQVVPRSLATRQRIARSSILTESLFKRKGRSGRRPGLGGRRTLGISSRTLGISSGYQTDQAPLDLDSDWDEKHTRDTAADAANRYRNWKNRVAEAKVAAVGQAEALSRVRIDDSEGRVKLVQDRINEAHKLHPCGEDAVSSDTSSSR